MKEGSAQQVLYNSALTLMTFTLTTWNLDVYNELELRPTLHILFRDSYLHWTAVVNSQQNHFHSHTHTHTHTRMKLQINSKLNMVRNVALGELNIDFEITFDFTKSKTAICKLRQKEMF